MKTQARIGYTFAIVAVATYAMNTVARMASGSSLASMLDLGNLAYLFYAVGFFLSAKITSIAMQGLQIIIVAIESILCLIVNKEQPFPGIALMIIALLLSFVYGAFAKNTKVKIIVSAFILYGIFLELPVLSIDNKYIRSLEWVEFIGAFFGVLWMICKDRIERIEYKEKTILKVAEEAASIAREAIELSKECGEGFNHG